MIAFCIKVGFQREDHFVSDESSSNLILCPMSGVGSRESRVGSRESRVGSRWLRMVCGSPVKAFVGMGLPKS